MNQLWCKKYSVRVLLVTMEATFTVQGSTLCWHIFQISQNESKSGCRHIYIQENYRKISNISRTESPDLKCFLSRLEVVFALSNETRC